MTDVRPEAARQFPRGRRTDTILMAFEQACDSRREAIAADLLVMLEEEIHRENTYPWDHRRNSADVLATAQARLQSLLARLPPPGSSICPAYVISRSLVAGCSLLENAGSSGEGF